MSSERHLHPVAMLIGAIGTLRRWISGLVFPGIVLLMSQGFSLRTVALFLLAVFLFAVLAALWGFLSWRATTYTVTENPFTLRRELEGTQKERTEESTGPTILRRLTTGDLLIAGATSGQIGVAFSLLAV